MGESVQYREVTGQAEGARISQGILEPYARREQRIQQVPALYAYGIVKGYANTTHYVLRTMTSENSVSALSCAFYASLALSAAIQYGFVVSC